MGSVAAVATKGLAIGALAAAAFGAAGAAGGAVAAAAFAAVPAALALWPLAFDSVREKMGPVFEGLKSNVEGFANSMIDQVMPNIKQFASMASGAFDALKPSLNQITPMVGQLITQLGEKLTPIAQKLGPFLVSAFEKGAPVLLAFVDALNPLIDGMDHFFKAISGPQLVDFVNNLGVNLGKILGLLGELIQGLLPIGSLFISVFGGILDKLTPVLISIGQAFEPLLSAIGRFIMNGLDAIGPPLTKIVELFSTLASGVLKALTPLLEPLANAFMQILEAIEPLIPIVVEFIGAWAGVLAEVLPVVAELATALLNALIPALQPVLEHVKEMTPLFADLVKQMGPVLIDVINQLAPLLPPLVQSFADFTQAIIPLLPLLAEMVATSLPFLIPLLIRLVEGVTKCITVVSVFVGWIVQIITWIGNWIVTIGQLLQGNEEAKQRLSEIWETIKTAIGNAVEFIRAWIAEKFGQAIEFIKDAWERAKQFTVEKWNALKQAVSDKIGEVIEFVRQMPGKIVSALGDLGSLLINAGKKVIEGFISGITSGFQKVKDTLGRLTSMLPDWKGPSSLDKIILFGNGQLVITGFIKGLESKYDAVESSLHSFTGRLSGMVDLAAVGSGFGFNGQFGIHGTINTNVTVEVKVDPTADRTAVGKEIADALSSYERVAGTRWRK
jgi:phage-related protein